MTEVQAAGYASAIGKLLHAHGPAPRARVVAALMAFGVSEDQVSLILERGLSIGLILEDPASAGLRAPPYVRRDASAFLGDGIIDAGKDPDVARRLAVLRILLSTLPVVMWVIDRSGYFVYWEGKAAERMGVAEGTFVGQNFYDMFANHASAAHFARALGGEISHDSWEYGELFWENWCFPIKNASGEVELAAFVSLDVTEAKRVELELRDKLTTIEQQQRVISELSTPIIEVWDKVMALPLLGAVDATRAGAVMTNLLAEVVGKAAHFVLLDLTGVEAVDEATASHILDLIRAVRLLGAEGIITGIRPSVAQTMVMLGVDLQGIVTHASLRQGLQDCMRKLRQGPRTK